MIYCLFWFDISWPGHFHTEKCIRLTSMKLRLVKEDISSFGVSISIYRGLGT